MDDTPSPHPTPAKTSIARGTAVVGSLTLLSRVLGFVRDLLVARLFGASPLADAFFVAFRIPNLMRSFVAEGAMTSAFVPVFTSELSHSQARAKESLRSISAFLLIVTSALSVLGIIAAEPLITLIAPGFTHDPQQFAHCVTLTQIMLPFVICISFVALLNGALNAVGIFGAAAMAQVWMNIVLILGALIAHLLDHSLAAIALAVSVVVGGVVQVASQLPALWKAGFRLCPSLQVLSPASRQLLVLLGPALLGATVYQIGIFLNTIFASVLAPGSVSWLFYADRLVQLPIGIFSIALASVLLPTLSRAFVDNDHASVGRTLSDALRFTSFIIFPLACGLYFFAHPLAAVLYERGAFHAADTHQTARAVQAYAFGIWATSCYTMLMRAFIARKDTRTPMLLGLGTLLVVVACSLALMGTPHHSETARSWAVPLVSTAQVWFAQFNLTWSWGHAGLAAASSIGACLSLIAAAVLVNKVAVLSWGHVAFASLRSLCAALIATGVAAWLCVELSPVLMLCVGVPVSVVLYVGISYLLKSEELRETLLRISQRTS